MLPRHPLRLRFARVCTEDTQNAVRVQTTDGEHNCITIHDLALRLTSMMEDLIGYSLIHNKAILPDPKAHHTFY